MEKSLRNIVVSGDVAVGSSTLAKNLAKALGWKYLSAGDVSRQYHLDQNIPLWNKAAVPEKFEKELDQHIFETLKESSGYVVDSHYASWFARDLEDIFRILLTCDLKEVQKRVAGRKSTHYEKPQEVLIRMQQLKDKFKKLYSDDNYEDPKFFNLVLDTTNSTPEETLEKALETLKSFRVEKTS